MGGQLVAQALIAASKTTDRPAHSLHILFVVVVQIYPFYLKWKIYERRQKLYHSTSESWQAESYYIFSDDFIYTD
jgi:hypothetical protein